MRGTISNYLKNDQHISFHDKINIYYKEKILAGFCYGKPIGSEVNRHAILHGYGPGFGKEIVSLKVILLLDYIIEAVDGLVINRVQCCYKILPTLEGDKTK
ncbi:hypothetical protein ACFVP7_10335 [Bacillus sp. SG20033]|uniref:hypothetical protein n=1 Tax=Bacillus sp. SG20033 TaxID=3366583 RepID=UPI0037CA3866